MALGSWGLAEWLRLRRRAPSQGASAISRDGAARLLWSLGALFALAHVAAAFHLVHGWSHASAEADTARQTQEALGFAFGAGVYVNYLFLSVWTADAAWWCLSPVTFRRRPAALDAGIRLFIFFIFVNGAIVFPPGPVRIVGTLVVIALGAAWYFRRTGQKTRLVASRGGSG
jgi:hypothetical protein